MAPPMDGKGLRDFPVDVPHHSIQRGEETNKNTHSLWNKRLKAMHPVVSSVIVISLIVLRKAQLSCKGYLCSDVSHFVGTAFLTVLIVLACPSYSGSLEAWDEKPTVDHKCKDADSADRDATITDASEKDKLSSSSSLSLSAPTLISSSPRVNDLTLDIIDDKHACSNHDTRETPNPRENRTLYKKRKKLELERCKSISMKEGDPMLRMHESERYDLISRMCNECMLILNLTSTFQNTGKLWCRMGQNNTVLPFQNTASPSKPLKKEPVNHTKVKGPPKQINGMKWALMNNERYRLASFTRFPTDSPISVCHLACRGFVYLHNEVHSLIICYFCLSRLTVFNDLENIDIEHKQLHADCPMVTEKSSINISMENQCPKIDAYELFSQLRASAVGRCDDQINESPAASSSRQQSNSNNFTSSQPSDESVAFVVITNLSDLVDSDAQHSEHPIQSSEVMEEPPPLPRHREEPIATSENPGAAQLSADDSNRINNTTANSNNNTKQPSTVANNKSTARSSSKVDTASVSQGSNSQQREPERSNSNTDDNSQETPSYEKLGIITARPKSIEYGVFATRMESFNRWPEDHHLKPLDLVKAGFFFTGYSDCARCFYCGGGLRNWERDDDVWVEHARWFPRCAFLLQEVGKDFIDTVQVLSQHTEEITITYSDVIRKMEESGVVSPIRNKEEVIARDPSVLTVVNNGFDKDQILRLAVEIRKEGGMLSSDKLYEIAKSRNIPKKDYGSSLGSDSISIRKGGQTSRDRELIETLRNEATELRQQTMCKICMDQEVTVAFLPCGHLVSCTECSCALTVCPLCRVPIKGIVRAHIT